LDNNEDEDFEGMGNLVGNRTVNALDNVKEFAEEKAQ